MARLQVIRSMVPSRFLLHRSLLFGYAIHTKAVAMSLKNRMENHGYDVLTSLF